MRMLVSTTTLNNKYSLIKKKLNSSCNTSNIMAFKAFLIAVVFTAIVAPALATDYIVGDDKGWRLEVDYTNWTMGKNFQVGDKLMFMYNTTFHNVAKVNGSDFQQCKESNSSNLLRSGSDTITLATPGKKWYICSVADHCSRGMKLVINVAAIEGPAPSPMPGWTASPPTSYASTAKPYLWILATMAAIKLIMA